LLRLTERCKQAVQSGRYRRCLFTTKVDTRNTMQDRQTHKTEIYTESEHN